MNEVRGGMILEGPQSHGVVKRSGGVI